MQSQEIHVFFYAEAASSSPQTTQSTNISASAIAEGQSPKPTLPSAPDVSYHTWGKWTWSCTLSPISLHSVVAYAKLN